MINQVQAEPDSGFLVSNPAVDESVNDCAKRRITRGHEMRKVVHHLYALTFPHAVALPHQLAQLVCDQQCLNRLNRFTRADLLQIQLDTCQFILLAHVSSKGGEA